MAGGEEGKNVLENLSSVQIETGSLAKSPYFLMDSNASLILARSDSAPAWVCTHAFFPSKLPKVKHLRKL